MFPSLIAWPQDLPLWLLRGHDLKAIERVEQVQFESGEDRHRETRTFTPYLASVSTLLLPDQVPRFVRFFEEELQNGTQVFDTKIGGVTGQWTDWWQVRFVGPYRLDQQHYHCVITAEVVLLDGPYPTYAVNPGDPPSGREAQSLVGRTVVEELPSYAVLTAPSTQGRTDPSSELWLVVDNRLAGRTDPESELQARIEQFDFLTLDAALGYLLTETGDRIILEP